MHRERLAAAADRPSNCVGASGAHMKRSLGEERALSAVRPELFAQLPPALNPDVDLAAVGPWSGRKVWWRCREGHEWRATVRARSGGTGCPICWAQRRATVPPARSLAAKRPDLVSELHPSRNGDLDASALGAGSGRRVWWRCREGHEWRATVVTRSGGTGCPICAKRRQVVRQLSLAVKHPGLAAELHQTRNGSLDPFSLAAHSNFKVWWSCACGHEWATSVAARSSGTGCPACAKRQSPPSERSLVAAHPELAAELHPTRNGDLDPRSLSAGSSWKVWWRCPAGHEWQARVSGRSPGTGCPTCVKAQARRDSKSRAGHQSAASMTESAPRHLSSRSLAPS